MPVCQVKRNFFQKNLRFCGNISASQDTTIYQGFSTKSFWRSRGSIAMPGCVEKRTILQKNLWFYGNISASRDTINYQGFSTKSFYRSRGSIAMPMYS